MKSLYIKAMMGEYFRYKRQHPILAYEVDVRGELANIITVSGEGHIFEIEVKVSMADLRHDAVKHKHARWRGEEPHGDSGWNISPWMADLYRKHLCEREAVQLAFSKDLGPSIKKSRNVVDQMPIINYFYFAVPHTMVLKAKEYIDSNYPYAGLFGVRDIGVEDGEPVVSARRPKLLADFTIGIRQCVYLSLHQSGTIVRLAKELALLKEASKSA